MLRFLAGPLFLLVQAVQVVRLIMFASKAMQIKMYSRPAAMKVPTSYAHARAHTHTRTLERNSLCAATIVRC